MRNYRLAIVVLGLVLTLGAAPSWAQDPSSNDTSDGNDNTGGGSGALVNNISGTFNTGYGHSALLSNTTGILNTAIGQGALQSNTSGFENTAVGAGALQANSGPSGGCGSNCGINNTAVGFQALFSNGVRTTSSNQGGSFNTAVGNNAMFSTNDFGSLGFANSNTAAGNNSLLNNVSGSFNTALGDSALLNAKSSGNIAIGSFAGSNLTSGFGDIYLGNNTGTGTESKTMRLGQRQTRTFIAGIQATPVTGKQVFITSSGQLGVLSSSARYKRDIQMMGDRSRGLFQLRAVTFRYKHDPHGERQYGLIAEEVAKVYPELVTKGVDGKVDSVQYHELIPMLLNEVQHQQQALQAQAQQLAQLKAKNARLQATLAEQSAALAARLERLEAAARDRNAGYTLRLSSVAGKINVK
jgi:endosialidase-like protein